MPGGFDPISLGVSAAGQVYGAVAGSHAAQKAAQQQQSALQRARAYLQDMLSNTQDRYAPYRGLGHMAMGNMGAMMGQALPQARSALPGVNQNYAPQAQPYRPPQMRDFTLADLMQSGRDPAMGGPGPRPSMTQTQADQVPGWSYANPGDDPRDVEWIRAWEMAHPMPQTGSKHGWTEMRRQAMESHFRPGGR